VERALRARLGLLVQSCEGLGSYRFNFLYSSGDNSRSRDPFPLHNGDHRGFGVMTSKHGSVPRQCVSDTQNSENALFVKPAERVVPVLSKRRNPLKACLLI